MCHANTPAWPWPCLLAPGSSCSCLLPGSPYTLHHGSCSWLQLQLQLQLYSCPWRPLAPGSGGHWWLWLMAHGSWLWLWLWLQFPVPCSSPVLSPFPGPGPGTRQAAGGRPGCGLLVAGRWPRAARRAPARGLGARRGRQPLFCFAGICAAIAKCCPA
jgi:hypothetical protein